jgi:hypothetical protein
MPKLTPIQLEDGTIILIEATEDAIAPDVEVGEPTPEGETPLVSKDGTDIVIQKFKAVEGTIKAYTNYALNAFKEVATANVDKVTLEFGIQISGEAGIPYITKGTAQSNLKITVECSFPKKPDQKHLPQATP